MVESNPILAGNPQHATVAIVSNYEATPAYKTAMVEGYLKEAIIGTPKASMSCSRSWYGCDLVLGEKWTECGDGRSGHVSLFICTSVCSCKYCLAKICLWF
jgi:hypothetical protein